MENSIIEFFTRFFKDPGPWVRVIIHLSLILIVAGIICWIFNLTLRIFRNRTHERPFFADNPDIYKRLRRTGYAIILVLSSISLARMFSVMLIEKILTACMVMIIAGVINTVIRMLIPLLQEKIAKKREGFRSFN